MSRLEAAPGGDSPGSAQGVRANESSGRFATTIPADPAAIPMVVDRVTRMLEEREWLEEDVTAVQLALTEAVANAIHHGCRDDVSKHVHCSVGCDDSGELAIVVRDPGWGFDPRGVPDPLDPERALAPSGRGIFLMRTLMDHVLFADGGREVQMRKRKTLERQSFFKAPWLHGGSKEG
jgi:serine/threonine-protein kinase RsbW